jgi:hypothetical protein
LASITWAHARTTPMHNTDHVGTRTHNTDAQAAALASGELCGCLFGSNLVHALERAIARIQVSSHAVGLGGTEHERQRLLKRLHLWVGC